MEPSASKVKTSVGFLSLPGFLHLVPPRSVQPQSHRPDTNNPNPYGRLLRSLTCPQVWPGAGVPGCPGHLENVTLRPCPSRWGAGEGKAPRLQPRLPGARFSERQLYVCWGAAVSADRFAVLLGFGYYFLKTQSCSSVSTLLVCCRMLKSLVKMGRAKWWRSQQT